MSFIAHFDYCAQTWHFYCNKISTVADRNKTESQNPKQEHKTQNRITKPKTEWQNLKQNHKSQNRITKI